MKRQTDLSRFYLIKKNASFWSNNSWQHAAKRGCVFSCSALPEQIHNSLMSFKFLSFVVFGQSKIAKLSFVLLRLWQRPFFFYQHWGKKLETNWRQRGKCIHEDFFQENRVQWKHGWLSKVQLVAGTQKEKTMMQSENMQPVGVVSRDLKGFPIEIWTLHSRCSPGN